MRHPRRVRPNQALQRTGSARGFTLLTRFQLRRRSGRPLNASSLGRTKTGGWAPLIRPLAGVAAGRCSACSPLGSLRRPPRLQPAGALVQPGPWHIRRVRPNQALQRTGSVCGFTLLARFQPRRRSGRPLNTSSLGRMSISWQHPRVGLGIAAWVVGITVPSAHFALLVLPAAYEYDNYFSLICFSFVPFLLAMPWGEWAFIGVMAFSGALLIVSGLFTPLPSRAA